MDAKKVGANIARLRKQKGMTQKELADSLNVIDKTISRWECGYGLPDIAMLPNIAKVFDISIEELIGEQKESVPDSQEQNKSSTEEETKKEEPQKSEENEPEPLPKKRNKSKLWILISSIVCCTLVAALVLSLTLIHREDEDKITGHSWEYAQNSKADYSFFTAFGGGETMSLELKGNLNKGTFVCTDTFYDKNLLDFNDCQVKGTYQIGDSDNANVIRFYTQKIIDPNNTGKFRYESSLGFDYYTATLESTVVDSQAKAFYDEKSLEAVTFYADNRDTPTSVFGRWTKYQNYFSRETSEIYFSRVHENAFTYSQYVCFPKEILRILDVAVPVSLGVNKDYQQEYYVGETIQSKNFSPYLLLSDDSKIDVTDKVTCPQFGKRANKAVQNIDLTYQDQDIKKTLSIPITVKDVDSWTLASTSDADYCFITYYSTNSVKAFSTLQLFGTLDNGTYVVSETYGKEGFTSYITSAGSYATHNQIMEFVSENVYTDKESTRFLTTSDGGKYYASVVTQSETPVGLSFTTSSSERNYFGYYTNGAIDEHSISRTEGEIYQERVVDGQLPDKIKAYLNTYNLMK